MITMHLLEEVCKRLNEIEPDLDVTPVDIYIRWDNKMNGEIICHSIILGTIKKRGSKYEIKRI